VTGSRFPARCEFRWPIDVVTARATPERERFCLLLRFNREMAKRRIGIAP